MNKLVRVKLDALSPTEREAVESLAVDSPEGHPVAYIPGFRTEKRLLVRVPGTDRHFHRPVSDFEVVESNGQSSRSQTSETKTV